MANDPIHQFNLNEIIPLEIGGVNVSFTNSALFMVATVAVTSAFFIFSTGGRGLIPSRMQSISEIAYEFVAGMLRDAAGSQGMKFFPFVFSLFMFILIANLFGMFPYFFTVTSHLIVTVALAMMVFSNRAGGGVCQERFWLSETVCAVRRTNRDHAPGRGD